MDVSGDNEQTAVAGYASVHLVAHSYLGSLWIALDQRHGLPGKPVLLRRVQLSEETRSEAFQRMACAGRDAMALSHENVLPVVDVLLQADSLALAYEYVEAEPLRALQSWATHRGLAFPVGVSLRLGMDLLRGVRALHGTLLGWPSAPPYGGLSPDSILVSRDGRTRLCDPLVSSCATMLEGMSLNVAKLAYTAPEQAYATAPLGAASDIFTCGVLLWELLAGNRLLTGPRAIVERKLLEHDLPSLRAQLPSGVEVSDRLVALVERCLASDAGRRPQSPEELASQLEQCGHQIASLEQVAAFVSELAGARFDQRRMTVRSLPSLRVAAARPNATPAASNSSSDSNSDNGNSRRIPLPGKIPGGSAAIRSPASSLGLGTAAASARDGAALPRLPLPGNHPFARLAVPNSPKVVEVGSAPEVAPSPPEPLAPASGAAPRIEAKPVASQLEAKPVAAAPDSARRVQAEPAVSKPEAAQPEAKRAARVKVETAAAQPEAKRATRVKAEPAAPKPEAAQPEATRAARGKAEPVAPKPEAAQPEAKRAARVKVETAAAQPEAKRAARVKAEPAAPKPEAARVQEPVAPRPEAAPVVRPIEGASLPPRPEAAPVVRPIEGASIVPRPEGAAGMPRLPAASVVPRVRAAPEELAAVAPRVGPLRMDSTVVVPPSEPAWALPPEVLVIAPHAEAPQPRSSSVPPLLVPAGTTTMVGLALPPSLLQASAQFERALHRPSPPPSSIGAVMVIPPDPLAPTSSAPPGPPPLPIRSLIPTLRPRPPSSDAPLSQPPPSSGALPSGRTSGWSQVPSAPTRPRKRAVFASLLATLTLGGAVATALVLRPQPDLWAAAGAWTRATRDSIEALGTPRAALAPPPAPPAPLAALVDAGGATSADAGLPAANAEPAPAAEALAAAPSAAPDARHAAELSDEQLRQLFALERRIDLPDCRQRLGASARLHNGASPKKSQAQLKTARRWLLRGNTTEAQRLLCSATAHSASNIAAWRELAELTLQLGDAAQAKQDIEQALKRKPNDAVLLGLLGDAQAMLGDLAQSRALWAKSLRASASDAPSARRLAQQFASIGERKLHETSYGPALAQYRRAVVLSLGDTLPSAGMGEALRLLGQPQAALAWSARATARSQR